MTLSNFSAFVYILSSISGVLYVGSTTDLTRRLEEHRAGVFGGFTKKYHCYCLVYFEELETLEDARLREIQLKKWRREKKIFLIHLKNPAERDLSFKLIKEGFPDV